MFPVLKEKRRQQAGELSGGQRQMVAMGRALMSQPQAAAARRAVGRAVSPRYVLEIFEHDRTVNASGVGILMVEQNARQALAFATKGFVLANGAEPFHRHRPELLADPEVGQKLPRGMSGRP